jgi:hypothetical protein
LADLWDISFFHVSRSEQERRELVRGLMNIQRLKRGINIISVGRGGVILIRFRVRGSIKRGRRENTKSEGNQSVESSILASSEDPVASEH